MSSSGRDQSERRSDYRDRIRAARERVNAVAAEREKLVATQASKDKNGTSNIRSVSHPAAQQQDFVNSKNKRPLDAQDSSSIAAEPAQGQMHDQIGAPPRPYRPERNSWFSIGIAPEGAPRTQPISSRQRHRNEIPSFAENESIYSQPSSANDNPGTFLTSSHASHPSDGSSLGDIPDFPVPDFVEDVPTLYQPNSSLSVRTRNIPPTSRRGTDSYYSHRSFISPIAEESPQSMRQSTVTTSEGSLEPVEERREHTFLEDSDDERHRSDPLSGEVSPIPVRQASVGRAAKPSVTVVRKKSDNRSKDHSRKISRSSGSDSNTRQSAARASSNLGLGVDGDESSENLQPPMPATGALPSDRNPLAINSSYPQANSAMDTVVEEILGGLQKGGALPPSIPATESQRPRLPPVEDRVSTTSLTDLIKRARKVRTNLDNGRTASRIGLNDFLNRSKERPGQHEKGPGEYQAWHPGDAGRGAVGANTQQTTGPFQDEYETPCKNDNEEHPRDRPSKTDRGRRCCGMPQWLFVLILVLIIICVAAAIIIPVELVVVPRQTANASSMASLSSCSGSNPCHNGGTSVIFNGTCSCACINGATGKSCENRNDTACSKDSSSVPGQSLGNITLGSSIPRFVQESQKNFSVNLNATALVGAFSAAGLDCPDENSLVTFQTGARKRSVLILLPNKASSGSTTETSLQTSAPSLRQLQKQVGELRRDLTSNNIVLDGTATTTASAVPSNATITTSSSSPAASTSAIPAERYIDFSGVAVLWILQNSNVETAEIAHSKLGRVLAAETFRPDVIDIGSGISVDLTEWTVTVPGMKAGTSNTL